MGRTCGMYWKDKTAYNILVGKPERKRQLIRYKRRYEDDIKIYFKGTV
jgi:hypothetical protein